MTKFKVQLRQRNIPKSDLISDIKKVANELSKNSLTSQEYSQKGRYGVNTYLRRFKSWNTALEEAGLIVINRQNIPEVELFQNIAKVWTKIGRQPFGRDMEKTNGNSNVSLGTYENRFGTWNNALLAFAKYIETGKLSDESTSQPIEPTPGKRTSRKINWRLRAQVLIAHSCICQMCGISPAKDPDVILHVDHIKPWSKGGETEINNLQALCEKCNVGKSDMYEEN